MSPPVSGEPAWHADPSGRHQHRWWDGAAFTDQVADDGVMATDAGAPSAPVAPGSQLAPAIAPPRRRRRAPLVLAAVGVVAIAAGVAYFVLTRDEDTGTGTFDGVIDGDQPAGTHPVSVSAGSVLTVEVEPSSDLDVVVGILVSDDDAAAIDDLYDDVGGADVRELADAFDAVDLDGVEDLDAGGRVVFRTDVGFPGDEEQLLLAVPFDVEATIVVAPFETGEAGEGDYQATIEAFDLEVDDDADIDELLRAVADSAEVPDDFRDLAEELLAGE